MPINLFGDDTLVALPNGNLGAASPALASTATVRSRWTRETRTLQVIVYDNSYVDRIFAAVITCSVNLLTGDTIVEAIDVERRVRVVFPCVS